MISFSNDPYADSSNQLTFRLHDASASFIDSKLNSEKFEMADTYRYAQDHAGASGAFTGSV